MKNTLKEVAEILFDVRGIDITKYETLFLEKSIQKRVSDRLCESLEDYCILLKQDMDECRLLEEGFSVSYSEFFRNSLTFSVLEKILIPSLLLNKKALKQKEIRVWSAASAAGQEAYSVAMLLNEVATRGAGGIDFRIFATDESQVQVDVARLGQYHRVSMDNVSIARLDKWFTKHGSVFKISDLLKEQVDFSVFDLLDNGFVSPPASIFGDFDIVFCANILFYYSSEFREFILNKVNKNLAENGLLITSETEREILIHYGFQEVFPQSAIFKRKL